MSVPSASALVADARARRLDGGTYLADVGVDHMASTVISTWAKSFIVRAILKSKANANR